MERLVIKFTKEKGAKFISHLDTMRTIHRAIRRAEVPIAYSKGFNPHPSISVASPLSLGFSSKAEYADIDMDRHMDTSEVIERLNKNLPDGMRVVNAVIIEDKKPSAMALVDLAKYHITMKHRIDSEGINKAIKDILSSTSILRLKKTKSGEKEVDIRPLIKNIRPSVIDDKNVIIECDLLTGSKGTLSPDMVANLIREFSNEEIYGYASILRTELYTYNNGKYITLEVFFQGK